MTKKTMDILKRLKDEINECIEKPLQLLDKLKKVQMEESSSKEALETGLAKLIRKIHKNKEGKFSDEVIGMAKSLRMKWRETHEKEQSNK